MKRVRANILVKGIVQGVGFRHFVLVNARRLNITEGYVRNLPTGDVEVVVEGERGLLNELIKQLRIGPRSAWVKDVVVSFGEPTGEFDSFEVRF
ncbi:acylphosphatase [bacterium]|nr:acylphosphatase [bacterium]